MRIQPRTVRYGGAMFDQTEINAVMAQMQDPLGLIPGKKVHEFEARVAEFMGKKYGVMVNSGSSALMVAMRLAQLPRGSEVITPVLTFSTTGDGQAWTVEILEGSNDGTPGYYARSDFNRALVQLTRSLATEAVDDLDNLFDGKPGEEPAETPPADGTPG